MESIVLLKQEINQTNEQEHDLAKWKLGVTAALGAAAFGIGKNDNPGYWLLLFIPFVCAYIDLFVYQYEIRILVLANFIRNHGQDDRVLNSYERECDERRGKTRVFSLGDWADLSCSLGASIIGPVFYFLHRRTHPKDTSLLISPAAAGVIWSAGVLLIVGLTIYFQIQRKALLGTDVEKEKQAQKARA